MAKFDLNASATKLKKIDWATLNVPFRPFWEQLGWLPRKNRGATLTIGLDIGLTSLRMVALRPNDDGKKELIEAIYRKTEGEPLQKLAQYLAPMLRGKPLDRTRIHVAISGASTLVRYITLPKMTEKELVSALPFEAEKYIPYSINEVVFDCHLLRSEEDERGKKVTRGILAVCKKDVVHTLCETCKMLGAPIRIIDAPPLAAINAFQLNYPEAAQQVIALLHVGYNASSLSILKKGEPVFTREIAFGGSDITQSIAKQFSISLEDAEDKKLAFRWNEDETLRKTVETSLHALSQEIRLSFNYFENHIPGAEIPEKLFISGVAAQIDQLTVYLTEMLKISADCWDPLRGVLLGKDMHPENLEKMKPGLAIAVGLALR